MRSRGIGWGRGVCWGRCRGIGWGRCRGILSNFSGISVVKFLAYLFGESELNTFAIGGSQKRNTFVDDNFGILNGGNHDGFFLFEDCALNDWQFNGFVHAALFRYRV